MIFSQRTFSVALVALAVVATAAGSAFGHYLWIAVDSDEGEHGRANIYFEESAAPGDGHYLDPIAKTRQTWIRTVEDPSPKPLDAEVAKAPGKRWLSADLTSKAPRSVDTYAKFGVYAYGKTNVLLHYYARALDVAAHEDLHELAAAEQMEVDIVPHDHGGSMQLKVTWKGEPQPNRPVYVKGPGGFRKNVKTNDRGVAQFEIGPSGNYAFRTYVEKASEGKDGGKAYTIVRRHATLRMRLPLEK